MNPLDPTLAALTAALLDEPDDDTVRLAYADALEDLGESEAAEAVRGQVRNPERVITLPGDQVGIPFAESVTVRRGFVEAVTIPSGRAADLGGVFRDHPVRVVTFADSMAVLEVGLGHPPPDDWGAPDTPTRAWVASVGFDVIVRAGRVMRMISEWREWPTRAGMLEGVGPWAAARVPLRPPLPVDFGEPADLNPCGIVQGLDDCVDDDGDWTGPGSAASASADDRRTDSEDGGGAHAGDEPRPDWPLPPELRYRLRPPPPSAD